MREGASRKLPFTRPSPRSDTATSIRCPRCSSPSGLPITPRDPTRSPDRIRTGISQLMSTCQAPGSRTQCLSDPNGVDYRLPRAWWKCRESNPVANACKAQPLPQLLTPIMPISSSSTPWNWDRSQPVTIQAATATKVVCAARQGSNLRRQF
jgi:hypothetical protein